MSMFAMPGAYDRAITVFSPDGRLFQVEYALEAVNRGQTIIGISCPEGVVLGAEERTGSRLQEPSFSQKLHEVDEHIGAVVVGISPDARTLIDEARVYSQSNRLMYDEPIDVEIVTKKIGDMAQLYTQHAGVRPFGVSIIFGGVDQTGARLFTTDPGGSYRAYRAVAIGIGKEIADSVLQSEYRKNLTIDESTKLAVSALVKAAQARDEKPTLKLAIIPLDSKKFRRLSDAQTEKYLVEALGSGTG